LESDFCDFLSNIFPAQSQFKWTGRRRELEWGQIGDAVDQTFRTKIVVELFRRLPKRQDGAAAVQDVRHDVETIQELVPIQQNGSFRKFGQIVELVEQKFVDQFLRGRNFGLVGNVPVDAQVVDVAGFTPILEKNEIQN
jgi:hypothetical protein